MSYYRIACGVAREPSMRALAFATVGLCVTGVGFTQTPTAVSGSAPQTFVSAHAPCLLLQNQCWGMAKSRLRRVMSAFGILRLKTPARLME